MRASWALALTVHGRGVVMQTAGAGIPGHGQLVVGAVPYVGTASGARAVALRHGQRGHGDVRAGARARVDVVCNQMRYQLKSVGGFSRRSKI